MKIEEAIKAMREGKKVRQKRWTQGVYLFKYDQHLAETCLNASELDGEYFFSSEWEIYEEKEK